MRFSTSTIVAALPVLAAAQESPFDQYKVQVQNVLEKLTSYIPNPGRYDPVAALAAKTGSMKLSILTLENWKETLYEPVAADAKTPEEWWVLVTGGNKTCFGRCEQVEKAFNETAGKFAVLPNAPHMALLNCDDQPVLCNAWSVPTANLYAFEMLPPPAQIEVYRRRLNTTTTTSDELVALQASDSKAEFDRIDGGFFHPFSGKLAELGLSVPFGYVMWAFGLVPNWLFMLLVSFGSRTMMGNRMQNHQNRGGAQGGAAAARAP